MRPPILLRGTGFALALSMLGGCLLSGDKSAPKPLTAASLEETGLIGMYDLADFRIEYSDGTVIDTSRVKMTGLLQVSADSAYVQRIWITEKSTDTRGRITGILAAQDNRRKGTLTLTLEGSSDPGETRFELRGDTLTWETEVEPSLDGRKPGFKETGRYLRSP